MVSFQKEKSDWELYTLVFTNLISDSFDNVLNTDFTVNFWILYHQQFYEILSRRILPSFIIMVFKGAKLVRECHRTVRSLQQRRFPLHCVHSLARCSSWRSLNKSKRCLNCLQVQITLNFLTLSVGLIKSIVYYCKLCFNCIFISPQPQLPKWNRCPKYLFRKLKLPKLQLLPYLFRMIHTFPAAYKDWNICLPDTFMTFYLSE